MNPITTAKRKAWQAAGTTLMGALLLLGTAQAQQPQRRHGVAPSNNNAKAVNAAQSTIEKKLDAIVIPELKFEDTSIEEAVDFLRTKSKELDTAAKDPAQKGLNFMLRAHRGFQAGRVTLNLKKVTMRKALENITEASGTRFHVDEAGVTVMPKDAPLEATRRTPKLGDPETLNEAAKKIVIPVVDFEDTTLGEAVAFFNQQIKAQSEGEPAFTLSIDPGKVDSSTPVKELRLRNVPALEALKYLANATHTILTAGEKEIWVTRP